LVDGLLNRILNCTKQTLFYLKDYQIILLVYKKSYCLQMFTRFSCEAMLYFDSKRRMWLNDTTQFIYISGKCKFAHNKP